MRKTDLEGLGEFKKVMQSLPQDWLGATAAKLEGLTKHSGLIYVWIFENGVNVNTSTYVST